LLPAADLWKLRDRGVNLAHDGLNVGPDLAENGFYHTLFLLKHSREDVLRLDLLILAFFGKRDRFLNGLLAANRKSVKSHKPILSDGD
jgi:hypothetical protein